MKKENQQKKNKNLTLKKIKYVLNRILKNIIEFFVLG